MLILYSGLIYGVNSSFKSIQTVLQLYIVLYRGLVRIENLSDFFFEKNLARFIKQLSYFYLMSLQIFGLLFRGSSLNSQILVLISFTVTNPSQVLLFLSAFYSCLNLLVEMIPTVIPLGGGFFRAVYRYWILRFWGFSKGGRSLRAWSIFFNLLFYYVLYLYCNRKDLGLRLGSDFRGSRLDLLQRVSVNSLFSNVRIKATRLLY